jgi:hypothetical protein
MALSYPIPDEALDERLGFIGTSGSGKTYNAGGGVERLLSTGARVVIVDPLGVWWGLRLLADGTTPSPFNVAIFGGPHGDLPLNEHVGALIGETAATMAESCIVDLSEFGSKAADRRFMVAFLETVFRKATGDPFHLIVDEADLFAPQKPGKGDEVLLGHMENIVRRGRVKGFMPWLISQRPAVLNKNVLSQVDGLVAFMLTASQDRKPLGEWVSAQADEGAWPSIYGQLPTLPIGTGVVWLPRRNMLQTAKFPPKLTFDSSATPKRGEKRQRRELKPLDLDKLKSRLTVIEEEAKANDPRTLRAEVARLTRELAKAQKSAPAAAWPDQREEVEGLRHSLETAASARHDLLNRLTMIGELADLSSLPAIKALAARKEAAPMAPVERRPAPVREQRQRAPQGDGTVPHGCAKPLAALAGVYPAGMTEAQWATAAGYKRSGGTWGAYRSRLTSAGLIEKRDGKFFATETGANAVGDVELPPPPGPDLARWWAGKLHGTPKLIEELIAVWPNGLSKDELAERVGMTATGGSFGAYISRLASPGLITRDGEIRLTEEVMGA